MATIYTLDSNDILRSNFWTTANLSALPLFVPHSVGTPEVGVVPAPPNDSTLYYLTTSGWQVLSGGGGGVTSLGGQTGVITLSGLTMAGSVLTSNYVPAAVAITGGAIDGAVIGGTTPAAGTFTSVTGTSRVQSDGLIAFSQGTALEALGPGVLNNNDGNGDLQITSSNGVIRFWLTGGTVQLSNVSSLGTVTGASRIGSVGSTGVMSVINDGESVAFPIARIGTTASFSSLTLASGATVTVIDNDGTLAANSATRIPTQAAVKSYIAGLVTGLLSFQGNLSASGNPNYPAATAGYAWYISAAGLIGGGSGIAVSIGDMLVCKTTNGGGNQASVGSDFFILEANIPGLTTLGTHLMTMASPGVTSFVQLNTDGTVTQLSASDLLTAIAGAPLASPAFTGTPTTPTQSPSDNSTKIASTAYVDAAVAGVGAGYDKYTAFLASWGNDGSAAVGNPEKPFVTAQAAYYAILNVLNWGSFSTKPICMTFLPGDGFNAGDVVCGSYSHNVYLQGWGASYCIIASFTCSGGIVIKGNGSENVTINTITALGQTVYFSNVNVGNVNVNGTPSYSGGGTGATGGNAGGVYVESGVLNYFSAQGGSGDSAYTDPGTPAQSILNYGAISWDNVPTQISLYNPNIGTDTWIWNGPNNYSFYSGPGFTAFSDDGYSSAQITVNNPAYYNGGCTASSDFASNVDGYYGLNQDGVAPAAIMGGQGGNGGFIQMKRSHYTAGSSLIAAGNGGAGSTGGATGNPGSPASRSIVYFGEVDSSGALNTSDGSVLTALYRGVIENGTFVDSQN